MASVVPSVDREGSNFERGFRQAQRVDMSRYLRSSNPFVTQYAWGEETEQGMPGDFVDIHPQSRTMRGEHVRNPAEVVKDIWSEESKGILSHSQCGICLENFNLGERVAVINCSDVKHVFHFDCLITGDKLNAKACPYCRRGIKYIPPVKRQVAEILDLIKSKNKSFVAGLKRVSDELLYEIYSEVKSDSYKYNFFLKAVLNDSFAMQDGKLFLKVFSIIMYSKKIGCFLRTISLFDENYDEKIHIAVSFLNDNPTLLKGFFKFLIINYNLIVILGIFSKKPKLFTKAFRSLCDIGTNDDGSYPYALHLMGVFGRKYNGKLLSQFVSHLSKGDEEDLSYIFEKLMYNRGFISNFFHYLPNEENPDNFSNFFTKILSRSLLVNKIFQKLSNTNPKK